MASLDEKLINEVGAFPFLYDCTLKNYKNAQRKDNAWKCIGDAIGLSGMNFYKYRPIPCVDLRE